MRWWQYGRVAQNLGAGEQEHVAKACAKAHGWWWAGREVSSVTFVSDRLATYNAGGGWDSRAERSVLVHLALAVPLQGLQLVPT